MSQHATRQDPETEAARWDSAIVHFIIYICDFPTVTCQDAFTEKDYWTLMDGASERGTLNRVTDQ